MNCRNSGNARKNPFPTKLCVLLASPASTRIASRNRRIRPRRGSRRRFSSRRFRTTRRSSLQECTLGGTTSASSESHPASEIELIDVRLVEDEGSPEQNVVTLDLERPEPAGLET